MNFRLLNLRAMIACLTAAMLPAAGCNKPQAQTQVGTSQSQSATSQSQVATSPMGAGVANVPILAPYQGNWQVDENKTVALWLSQGTTQTEINSDLAEFKKLGLPLHLDLHIQGNVAVEPWPAIRPGVNGEYLFFALHLEGPGVCGKAWHHEDRTDPGNHISKHYIRLAIKNGDLWLSDREQEDVNPNDPDLMNMPVTGGSAATCMADKAPAAEWSPWVTYIFSADSTK
jgi:hypothetical protein